MNTDLKQKWVKALRSGEFRQRKGGCVGVDGTCCAVGVLAKVLEKEGLVEIKPTRFSPELLQIRDVASSYQDGCRGSLPTTVLSSLQLSCSEESEIVHMNDVEHRSFESIANHIETHL